nr:hypothetical protein [Clostridium gasigenes]
MTDSCIIQEEDPALEKCVIGLRKRLKDLKMEL